MHATLLAVSVFSIDGAAGPEFDMGGGVDIEQYEIPCSAQNDRILIHESGVHRR
jgi:hypothetical protein